MEAREAAEHPTMYNASPLFPGESYPSPNSQRLRLRNPGPQCKTSGLRPGIWIRSSKVIVIVIYGSSDRLPRPRLGFCLGRWCHSHFSREKNELGEVTSFILTPRHLTPVRFKFRSACFQNLCPRSVLTLQLGAPLSSYCGVTVDAAWEDAACLVTPLRISLEINSQSVKGPEPRTSCSVLSGSTSLPSSVCPILRHQHCHFLPPLCPLFSPPCTSWFQDNSVLSLLICLSVSPTGLCVSWNLEGNIPVLGLPSLPCVGAWEISAQLNSLRVTSRHNF